MQRKHNTSLVPLAKNLRKNMTKEERRLWYDFLREYPVRFYRQKVLGKYIADFYCAKAKLVVELDGSQHYSPEGLLSDAVRTEFLADYSLHVLRIPNNAVTLHCEGVCQMIDLRAPLNILVHSSGLLFFRHTSQKCSEIHPVFPVLFVLSAEKTASPSEHTEFLEVAQTVKALLGQSEELC